MVSSSTGCGRTAPTTAARGRAPRSRWRSGRWRRRPVDADDQADAAHPAPRDRLTAYAEYRARLHAGGGATGQDDVDRVLGSVRPTRSAPPPRGMGRETLDAVVTALRSAGDGLSAAETAERIGASRITARRYLEYLADTGLARGAPRYGGAGRPELEYRRR